MHLLMKRHYCWVLAACFHFVFVTGCLAFAARAVEVTKAFDFEDNSTEFTIVEGKGEISLEKNVPLHGAASLLVEMDPVSTVTIISASFTVKPSCIYCISWTPRTDVGTFVDASLILEIQEHDYEYKATRANANNRFVATFPGVISAKLKLICTATASQLRKKVILDDIVITEMSPLLDEEGGNQFFNGSFEIDTEIPPPGWGSWEKEPIYSLCNKNPQDGKFCLAVTNAKYIIPPFVPVKSQALYHVKCHVRGKGNLHAGIHKLTTENQRIGWAGPLHCEQGLKLQPDEWQLLEFMAISETPEIAYFCPYISVSDASTVFIDNVSINKIRTVSFGSQRQAFDAVSPKSDLPPHSAAHH